MSKVHKVHQCGSCLFLNREKKFEKVCTNLGRLPTSKSCTSFRPDAYGLVKFDPHFNDIEMLAPIVAKMSTGQLEIFSALMLREKITRKYGFKFFQKVYVKYNGRPNRYYISNFAAARVLDCDSTHIRLICEDPNCRTYLVLEHEGRNISNSVYRTKDFAELRKDMIGKSRLIDPSVRPERMAELSRTGRIAPLREVIESELFDQKKVHKKKMHGDDLVSFISKMSRGLYGSREIRESEHEVKWA